MASVMAGLAGANPIMKAAFAHMADQMMSAIAKLDDEESGFDVALLDRCSSPKTQATIDMHAMHSNTVNNPSIDTEETPTIAAPIAGPMAMPMKMAPFTKESPEVLRRRSGANRETHMLGIANV